MTALTHYRAPRSGAWHIAHSEPPHTGIVRPGPAPTVAKPLPEEWLREQLGMVRWRRVDRELIQECLDREAQGALGPVCFVLGVTFDATKIAAALRELPPCEVVDVALAWRVADAHTLAIRAGDAIGCVRQVVLRAVDLERMAR